MTDDGCVAGRSRIPVTLVRIDENGRALTEGPQVEIGGNDRYVSVSRAEYEIITSGRGRIEPKQTMLPLGDPEAEGGD